MTANEWAATRQNVSVGVVNEVLEERARQDQKWGEQHHPDGTGGPTSVRLAQSSREFCNQAAALGRLEWRHILREEYREAMAEADPAKLREELIQVAAVCVAWVEDIDSRA